MRMISPLLLVAVLGVFPALTVHAATAAPTTAPSTDLDPAENARRVAELPTLETYLKELTDMRTGLNGDVKDPKGFRHSAVNDLNDAIRNMRDIIAEYKGDTASK